jgi:SAM-dependent methyltransferase
MTDKDHSKMTKLYSTLANIYHEMYQHVFDYDKEFEFYDSLLKKNKCNKILEIGCGSGMLARRFIAHEYDYLGLDLFNEMLDIARTEVQSDRFVQCDMRDLSYRKQFDAVMITGRSISYVIDNKGIIDTLNGVHESLPDHGLFVFGVFEANGIFGNFDDFEQHIEHGNKKITRISKLKKNLATGWTYDWFARYIIDEGGKVSEFDDITTLRTFTKDEILLFLKLTGFHVMEIIEEPKTLTVIAEKK